MSAVPLRSLDMPSRPVTLVTGAARRIGRVIAEALANAGHDLALHCRTSRIEAEQLAFYLRGHGARAEVFEADLSDEDACRALVPAVLARLGRLDHVVNNASTFEYDAPGSFSHAAMERHWRANTAPAILLAEALHRHLVARDAPAASGCVVNLLDQKLANPNPDYFSYTLSKAALEAAGVMLAQALAPQVRVVGISPGVTLLSGPMNDDEFSQAHRLTPLGRSSTPDDVARAVRFAIESPAITGTTLMVDGGQHLRAQPRDVLHLVRDVEMGADKSADTDRERADE
jgi:NAD(P)-dependent dehydrogenase (short-subunit alcohol dehydrogenase family)